MKTNEKLRVIRMKKPFQMLKDEFHIFSKHTKNKGSSMDPWGTPLMFGILLTICLLLLTITSFYCLDNSLPVPGHVHIPQIQTV